MTGRDRIARILRREPVDRIGVYEHFWPAAVRRWVAEGRMAEGEDPDAHFALDMAQHRPFDMNADFRHGRKVIAQTERHTDYLDGNGATLRKSVDSDGGAVAVEFSIRERADWAERIRPHLVPARERIDVDGWRATRERAHRHGQFLVLGNRFIFQMIEMICGHEYMLMGMALDPDWVREMADAYAALEIGLMDILFAEAGPPDGLWLNEDLGFKHKPFMRTEMFLDIVQPAQKRVIDFAHGRGLPVIVHSCGFMEPLIPGLIDAGMDCLQTMEVKAGMDARRIMQAYGDRIALCGGLDARNLVANDRDAIRAELEEKLPALKQGGYIFHSDHSITTQVEYDTYRFFLDEGLRLGRYA